jgi:hypothetical protein
LVADPIARSGASEGGPTRSEAEENIDEEVMSLSLLICVIETHLFDLDTCHWDNSNILPGLLSQYKCLCHMVHT